GEPPPSDAALVPRHLPRPPRGLRQHRPRRGDAGLSGHRGVGHRRSDGCAHGLLARRAVSRSPGARRRRAYARRRATPRGLRLSAPRQTRRRARCTPTELLMLLEWIYAFLFTQAVEVPIYVFALRGGPETPPQRALAKRVLIAFGASALTHPIVWFVIPQ